MRDFKFIFSQNNPRWSRTLINNVNGATLGLYGCLVISWEMKANYYGHFLTPPQLANLLSQHSLFTNGDFIVGDDVLEKVFSDIKYVNTLHYEDAAADLAELQKLSDSGDNITVTLELDFDHNPSDGIQTHFVELHSYNGSVLRIFDPWDGKEKDFTDTYGNDPATTIQKYIVYTGAPSNADREQTAGSADMMPVKINDWKGLLTEAGNLEAIALAFEFSQIDCKTDATLGNKVVNQIHLLQDELIKTKEQVKVLLNTPPSPVSPSSVSSAPPPSAILPPGLDNPVKQNAFLDLLRPVYEALHHVFG